MFVPLTLRVRALIMSGSSILLCRLRARPVVFLPGGRVEAGEDLNQALAREMLEETGVMPEAAHYLGAVEHFWSEGARPVHDLTHFFLVDSPTLSPAVVPPCIDEEIELFWAEVETLSAEPLEPAVVRDLITAHRGGDSTPWWRVVRG